MSTQQNKDSNPARATPEPANLITSTPSNTQGIDDMWANFDKSIEEWFAQNDAGFDDVSMPLYTGPSMTSPEVEMTGAGNVAESGPSNRTADSTTRPVAADANMPSTRNGLASANAGITDPSRVAAFAEERENAKRIYAHRRAEYESGPPNVFQPVPRSSQEVGVQRQEPEDELRQAMQRIQELVIGWEEEIKRVQKARQEASRLQLRLDNGQDELRIQRNRCEMFQRLLRVETRNHAQTHARLTDVEAMNLKWQDKYEAARAEVRRLQVDSIRVHNELSDARDVIKAFEAEKERN
ncbi:hypothetical protein BJX66DRAFT_341226 [Aspergillus keveii]|uniref:Uncharacterized protein n=1 Tax=Aspergillus keveii TaxID=714993 RepID=A0ABR4FVW9_9EURO